MLSANGKSILQYGIPYLTFCAVLSNISYWSTFNVNVFEFLQITDLITSFIYPIFFNSITLIVPIVFLLSFKPQTKRAIILSFLACFLLQIFLLSSSNPPYTSKVLYIVSNLVFVIAPLLLTATTFDSTKEFTFPGIESSLSLPVLCLVIYFPIASFLLAKANSLFIVYDLQYDYVIINNDENSKSKYIGSVGDFVFTTSMDNNDLIIHNKSSIQTMKLYHFTVKTSDGGNPPVVPLRPPGF